MTHNELGRLAKKYDHIVDLITDTMTKYDVPPIEGENLLAMIIGMSVGLRQGSLITEGVTACIALGYQFAAQEGDNI